MAGGAAAEFDPARLRRAREQAQLSQVELGLAVGTDGTTIAKYETGARAPRAGRTADMAEVLNLKPSDLLRPGAGIPTLADLRVAAGLSQQAAATAAGLVRTRYSMLERGEVVTLQPGIAEELAKVFGVSIDAIRTAHSVSRAEYMRRPGMDFYQV